MEREMWVENTGHSVCLKSILKIITMQGLTLAVIVAAENNCFNARVDVNC